MKNVTIGNETYQGVNKVELNGTDGKPCIFTDTSGATATAGDMGAGKTAYVDGELVTGDVPVSDLQEIISTNNAETTFENNAIEMTYSTTEEKLHKQGFSISLRKPSDFFGNATDPDVLSGKTYTAAGGIAKVGTHVCQAPSDNSSNATAAPEDMAKGKTAVVKGELITGDVETAESGNTKTLNRGTVRYSTGTGTVKVPVFIFKSGEFTKQLLFRNGSYAEFDTLASQFGDAEDENVVSGKIYTSKNGFAKTGTHVCAKPSGTIEITTNGIHNVSSYATANVNIPQNGAGSSGYVEKSGAFTIDETAETYTINTGLSLVKGYSVKKASVPTEKAQYAWSYMNGIGVHVYVSSYSQYVTMYSVGNILDTDSGISGGAITLPKTLGANIIPGEYQWAAYGVE